jgi:hypothetical protein
VRGDHDESSTSCPRLHRTRAFGHGARPGRPGTGPSRSRQGRAWRLPRGVVNEPKSAPGSKSEGAPRAVSEQRLSALQARLVNCPFRCSVAQRDRSRVGRFVPVEPRHCEAFGLQWPLLPSWPMFPCPGVGSARRDAGFSTFAGGWGFESEPAAYSVTARAVSLMGPPPQHSSTTIR